MTVPASCSGARGRLATRWSKLAVLRNQVVDPRQVDAIMGVGFEMKGEVGFGVIPIVFEKMLIGQALVRFGGNIRRRRSHGRAF